MHYDEFPDCCGVAVIGGFSDERAGNNYKAANTEDFDKDLALVESDAVDAGYTVAMATSVPSQHIFRRLQKNGYVPVLKFTSSRTNNEITVWVKLINPDQPLAFLKAVKMGEVANE